jgi:hypothetical protein
MALQMKPEKGKGTHPFMWKAYLIAIMQEIKLQDKAFMVALFTFMEQSLLGSKNKQGCHLIIN